MRPSLIVCSTIILAAVVSGCSTMSPGIEAIEKRDVAGLRNVLDSGTSPEFIEEKGKIFQGTSLLQLALASHFYDAATLLMDRGADPSKAAKMYFVMVESNGQVVNEDKTIGMLLGRGMNPNVLLDASGRRPIHYLCEFPSSIEILIKAGADVKAEINGTDRSGNPEIHTPITQCLHRASVHAGSIQTFQNIYYETALLLNSVDPNYVQRQLQTYRKRKKNALDGAITLLRLGADPNGRHVVKNVEFPAVISAIELNPQLGRALLDRGADILAESKPNGITVLHNAAKYGSGEDVRDILERGKKRFRVLSGSDHEATRRLKAWINQTFSNLMTSEFGTTALHRAADEGKLDTLRVLIEYGADPSIINKSGKTAQNVLDDKAETKRVAMANAKAAEKRRAEQAIDDAHEAAANRQAVLAVFGAAVIHKGMSGPNYTDAQRREVIGAYATDRGNAANGVESDNFAQATDKVKQELDLSALARQRDRNNRQAAQERPVTRTVASNSASLAAQPRSERSAIAQPRPSPDPDPYKKDIWKWRLNGNSSQKTRDVSCREAKARADSDNAKTAALGKARVVGVSPCVCEYADFLNGESTASWICNVYVSVESIKGGGPTEGVSR